MNRIAARIILVVLGLAVIVFFALPYLVSWQVSESHQETWQAMKQKEFTCPENTEATFRGWSEAGYMRYCEPRKNGPWEAWSGGYLHVSGEYLHGQKHGVWRWYNSDGTIQTTKHYSNGQEVTGEQ